MSVAKDSLQGGTKAVLQVCPICKIGSICKHNLARQRRTRNTGISSERPAGGDFPPEAPVDGDVIIQQDVRQAPFRTVLCDDAHVWDLDGTADKFAQVGVVQLSVSNQRKDKHRRV